MVENVRSSSMRARAAWSAGAVLLATATVLLAGVRPATASGSVALFDDDGGAALFTGGLLAPGRTQTACVSVDASGADPADTVVLLADSLAGALVPYLTVTVESAPAGTWATAPDSSRIRSWRPGPHGSPPSPPVFLRAGSPAPPARARSASPSWWTTTRRPQASPGPACSCGN